MDTRRFSILLATALLSLLVGISSVAATRCQIRSVAYSYPQQADPNQQIEVDTKVAGSCVSTGEDYYSLRVDLVDMNSTAILSTSSTPIGYSANNFTITGRNFATAPVYNATWPLQMDVYVIRAGGTNGAYLLDYKTVGNATIQVGTVAVPEFRASSWLTVVTSLVAVALITSRRIRPRSVKGTLHYVAPR
jgi:hypothetical protein